MIGAGEFFIPDTPWLPVIIFALRVVDVSLGTVRVICVTRGRRFLAVTLGFVEILVWVTSISAVFAHLDNVINILAWATGFATGNLVGMWIEDRLALGVQAVSLISRGKSHAVAEGLRLSGLCVTSLAGGGGTGPVALCTAIVPRRHAPQVIHLARLIDPDVVVTVEDVRQTTAVITRGNAGGKIPLPFTGRLALRLRGTRTALHAWPDGALRVEPARRRAS
jgi:uncharacterized protein YebE (UPF0316 family)